MAFDGAIRSCVKYSIRKGGVLRCDAFKEGQKYPSCPQPRKLKGGGRSQAYIRGKTKPCGAAVAGAKRKSKSSKRKSRKSKR